MKVRTILITLSSALLFAACNPTAPTQPEPVKPDPTKPASGSLDTTFGSAGVLSLPQGLPSTRISGAVRVVQSLPDGGVLTAGCVNQEEGSARTQGFVQRFSKAGAPGAIFVISPSSEDSCLRTLAQTPEGKVVSGGWYSDAGLSQAALFRFSAALGPDAVLDLSAQRSGATDSAVRSSAQDAQGNLYVAGYGVYGGVFNATVLRFKPDGSLDKTFGSAGLLKTTFGDGGKAADGRAIGLSGAGQLYLAANVYDPSDASQSLNVVPLSSSGTPGTLTTLRYGNPQSFPWTLASSGETVAVGGYTIDAAGKYASVIQILGGLSRVLPNDGSVRALFFDAQKRLIAVGNTFSAATDQDCFVTRLNPDLTPDSSFGVGGTVTLDRGGNEDLCWSGALDAQGRIVVGGESNDLKASPKTYARLLARINP